MEKKPTAPKVRSFSIKTACGNGKLASPKTKPSQVRLRYEGKVEGRDAVFVAVQFAVDPVPNYSNGLKTRSYDILDAIWPFINHSDPKNAIIGFFTNKGTPFSCLHVAYDSNPGHRQAADDSFVSTNQCLREPLSRSPGCRKLLLHSAHPPWSTRPKPNLVSEREFTTKTVSGMNVLFHVPTFVGFFLRTIPSIAMGSRLMSAQCERNVERMSLCWRMMLLGGIALFPSTYFDPNWLSSIVRGSYQFIVRGSYQFTCKLDAPPRAVIALPRGRPELYSTAVLNFRLPPGIVLVLRAVAHLPETRVRFEGIPGCPETSI
ncbi:hypothetical protein B0H14DRAFT_3628731 [Mycena olivaceomarginata]|nr:hypothetical protein B0H14DRAFT_3628731 [Mycena olivaceomarginata]